jgi:hypothetical protein
MDLDSMTQTSFATSISLYVSLTDKRVIGAHEGRDICILPRSGFVLVSLDLSLHPDHLRFHFVWQEENSALVVFTRAWRLLSKLFA